MWGTEVSVNSTPSPSQLQAAPLLSHSPPPAASIHLHEAPAPRGQGCVSQAPEELVKTTQTTLQNQRPGPHFAQIKFYCCWNRPVCLAWPNPDGIFLQPCKRNQAAGEAAQPRGFGWRRKVGLAWEPS